LGWELNANSKKKHIMATATIVVIITITINIVALYLSIGKYNKLALICLAWIGLSFYALLDGAINSKVPAHILERIEKAPTVEGKQYLMARFSITEEMLKAEEITSTPVEAGVSVSLVFALVFTPILLIAARSDDDKMKKLTRVALFLNIMAMAFWLSLYFGLRLIAYL
jgi:hypothetical protein